jgi:hypothetical protein
MTVGEVEIKTRKLPAGGYRATVTVRGDFYASADASTREAAIAEANHYAAQIEFDEFGNW